MASLNRWEGIGKLGKNPEARNMENGNKVANISIAITETFKDKQGVMKEQTEWVNIALWNGLATVAENHLKKGDQIFVSGKLRTRTWERDGVSKNIVEIHADSIIMLGSTARMTPRPVGEVNGNRADQDFNF